MTEIIIASIGLFTTIGAWFISRRKNRAEANALELQNAERIINLWKDLYDELNKKVQSLDQEISTLRRELESMEKTSQRKCETCKYKKAYENR